MPVDPKDFSSYLLRTRHELKSRFKKALRETRTPQSVAYNAFSAWLLTHTPEIRRELLTQMIACLDPADLDAAEVETDALPDRMKPRPDEGDEPGSLAKLGPGDAPRKPNTPAMGKAARRPPGSKR